MMPEIVLIVSGALIGIFATIVGGGMFFSVPLFQLLFPQATFGAIVGNIKVSSLFRGLGTIASARKLISPKESCALAIPIILGTLVGASVIAQLSQKWIFPIMLLAVFTSEYSDVIKRHFRATHSVLASVGLGVYTGFLGAGSGILMITLFRIKHPEDEKIAWIKIQVRFVEFLAGLFAVFAHYLHGNIDIRMWLSFSVGTFIGGILGGFFLNSMTGFTGHTQKLILRIAFALALIVSASQLF